MDLLCCGRFDLALQLKEMRTAYQIAQETDVSPAHPLSGAQAVDLCQVWLSARSSATGTNPPPPSHTPHCRAKRSGSCWATLLWPSSSLVWPRSASTRPRTLVGCSCWRQRRGMQPWWSGWRRRPGAAGTTTWPSPVFCWRGTHSSASRSSSPPTGFRRQPSSLAHTCPARCPGGGLARGCVLVWCCVLL